MQSSAERHEGWRKSGTGCRKAAFPIAIPMRTGKDMNSIRIPDHSVVIAIGGKRAPLAEVLDLVPAPASPWRVDDPDASAEALRTALKATGRARVAIARAHAKAVRDVISIAHKHGARAILLRLPNSPDVTEGMAKVDAVHDVAGTEELIFEIEPMPSDLRHITGPFDIIGDVHGAADELRELLTILGHMADGMPQPHPQGRIPVMLGDYTDRGTKNREVLEIVRDLTRIGGIAILGNHDAKLIRWLRGKSVEVKAGFEVTMAELESTSPEWRSDMADWLESLETHHVLDGGRLVVAHAGLSDDYHGRHTSGARAMALYGKPIHGGTVLDEDGYPMAADWALDYTGEATVVHGHIIHDEPRIVNNVVAIDTAAVYGGRLTAYRWPERDFVSVKAHDTYYVRRRRDIDGEKV